MGKNKTMNSGVKIRLFRGNTKIKITDSTENDGLFEWKIPEDIPVATNYFIRVKTVDNLFYDDSEPKDSLVREVLYNHPEEGKDGY